MLLRTLQFLMRLKARVILGSSLSVLQYTAKQADSLQRKMLLETQHTGDEVPSCCPEILN